MVKCLYIRGNIYDMPLTASVWNIDSFNFTQGARYCRFEKICSVKLFIAKYFNLFCLVFYTLHFIVIILKRYPENNFAKC